MKAVGCEEAVLTVRRARVFATTGRAYLGPVKVPSVLPQAPFILIEVGLGALAATLAAETKGKSADFLLVVTIPMVQDRGAP